MWFYHVSFVVITCIFFALWLSFLLGLRVPSYILFSDQMFDHFSSLFSFAHVTLPSSFCLFRFLFFPPSSVIYFYSYHDLFSFFSPLNCLFIIFILCTLPRSVRYQRRPRSHSFPLRIHPKPNRAQCHAGTSSKPASREWWSSLCHSDTCSSACVQGLTPVLDLQHGAFPLPSGKTSPGRVYLFPGNQTQGVAWAAGGLSRTFAVCWPWQSI